jgi:adenylate kinase family enzyme
MQAKQCIIRPWSYRLSYLSGGLGAVRARKYRCFRNTSRSKITSNIYSILRQVNVFRQFIKEHSLSSRLAAETYKTGNRQPDFIAVWMWSHLLVDRVTGEEHIVFDGTPRSLQEAQIIDTAIDFYSRQRPQVIYLNISRETSKARMIARRRMDDINAEEVERRLNWFESDVLPAVEYFRKYSKYNFIELDGDQPVEAVQQQLLLKAFG